MIHSFLIFSTSACSNDSRRSDKDYPQLNNNYYINNDFRQMNQAFPPPAPSDHSFTPLNSSLYNSFSSSILQTLFDEDFDYLPLQSLSDNRTPNYSNYPIHLSAQNFPNLTETYAMEKPNSFPKKHTGNNHLQFCNNTPFWNSTPASVLPPAQPQFHPPSLARTKPNLGHSNTKVSIHPSIHMYKKFQSLYF